MQKKRKLVAWGGTLVSFALVVFFACACIPSVAFAAVDDGIASVQGVDVVDSGTWGTCPWEIDSEGTLTVHAGVGEDCRGCPWTNGSWIKNAVFEDGVVLPASCNSLFAGTSLISLDATNWDTSAVTDMGYMFFGCKSLTSLNASGWDTSNVTNMDQMFLDCHALASVDTTGWNLSNSTYMFGMFLGCRSLTDLDTSKWDTSSVTNMGEMFYGCSSLVTLDVSDWNTSSVEDMHGMFQDCINLISLDVSKWDTSSVTRTDAMFYGCTSLDSFEASGWDTSSLTDTSVMFNGCSSLSSLDVAGWNTSCVKSVYGMFSGCTALTFLDMSSWNTKSVGTVYTFQYASVFDNCENLSSIVTGTDYEFLESDLFPNATAANGKWWSYEDQQWYTKDEIVATRSGIADTYTNTEIEKPSDSSTTGVDILRVTSPANYISKSEFGETYMYTVPYKYQTTASGSMPSCSIRLNVSSGATWSLYKDAQCTESVATKDVALPNDNGDNYFFVKVVNGDASAVYCLNIVAERIEPDPGERIVYHGSKTSVFYDSLVDVLSSASSTVYNTSLSYMLASLSASAYNQSNVTVSLVNLGLDGISPKYTDVGDSCARCFARGKTSEGRDVITVVIRGSGSDWDWLSNLNYGTDRILVPGWHRGFAIAAEEVYNDLVAYTVAQGLNNPIYVITGHSRGAAVANLLSMMLSRAGVSKEDVFDYNFACPDIAKALWTEWNWLGEHDNIFNIGNQCDVVTYCAGAVGNVLTLGSSVTGNTWGKYGQTRWMGDAHPAGASLLNVSTYHDQERYVAKLKSHPAFYTMLTYEQSAAGLSDLGLNANKWWNVVVARCPVDIEVLDEKGNVMASVTGEEADYHGHDFGEVIVFVDGDEKAIAVPNGTNCSVRLVGTAEGTMSYEVGTVDVCNTEVHLEKTFEGVALVEGKTMISNVVDGEGMGQSDLMVLNNEGEAVAKVLAEGSELKLLERAEANVDNLTYTGQALTPRVTVTLDGVQLIDGDFTVAYANESGNVVAEIKNAGSYTATITGVEEKGYTGQASVAFTVGKANPHVGIVTADVVKDDLDAAKVVMHRSDDTVPGTLALLDSSLAYGTKSYRWTFNPSDASNYEAEEGTVDVTVTGHVWGQPTYVWSSDNTTCTATRNCVNNSDHKETETARTTFAVTREPTETTEGERIYTAKFGNTAFEAQVKNAPIPKKASSSSLVPNPTPEPTPEPEPASSNSAATTVTYTAHVQGYGDLPAASDGATAGTVGESRRLEAISATIPAGGIRYRSHVQGIGWQDWVSDGASSGTTGESRRVEALQMALSDELVGSGHHVWYRVHSQTYGWLGWAHDGEPAGTAGQSKRIEAYEVVVLDGNAVPNGYDAAIPSYVGAASGEAHVQTYGWQTRGSSLILGTTGQSKRLEALRLLLNNQPCAGDIAYQVHEQGNGWTAIRADGELAGTTGESRRLEAVRISLTGDELTGGFSVWYRVHCQTFGWLGWAHDGEDAGTTGLSRRAEAVEVQILPLGATPMGYDASKRACVNG